MSSECPQLGASPRCDRERVDPPASRASGASHDLQTDRAIEAGALGERLRPPDPPADGVARQLREQAQGALGELLRGFQSADRQGGDAASGGSAAGRRRLHAGLVTALMRLILLLYAEARGLLAGAPDGGAPDGGAPLTRLFEELEAERRGGGDL
ncbi:hypothetical protein BE20_54920, partial [Sorangium cellulosum]